MSEQNGSDPKLFDHTFTDTGYTVKLRKVSPTLIQDIRLAYLKTKPDVPLSDPIETPGPMKGKQEELPDDPTYQKQLADWLRMVNNKITEMQIERAVVEIMSPGWEAQVAEIRGFLEGLDVYLPASDKVLWVTRIAAGTDADLQELADAIQRRSHPTEEVIAAATETFRPAVSRPGRRRD